MGQRRELTAAACLCCCSRPTPFFRLSMSSRSGAVQRHGRSGQPAGQFAASGPQQSSNAAAGGLKTWHLWMLFGFGWPSILLFFLSTIPAFSSRVQGLLLTFGWLFCASWMANSAVGLMTDHKTKKQETVFTASYITAGIGSLIGFVLTASYAVHNWPWLYIFGFAAVVGAVFVVRSLDDGTASKAATPEGEGAAAGAPAAAGGAAEVGDVIDLSEQ